jgi:hypothetical protein
MDALLVEKTLFSLDLKEKERKRQVSLFPKTNSALNHCFQNKLN